MLRKWDDQHARCPRHPRRQPHQIFFLGLVAFVENPFAPIAGGIVPADGNGLNPCSATPA